MRLSHVYILIGSNVEPQRNVLRALEALRQWYNVTAVSPIYESADVEAADAPVYWNMAVQIETYTLELLLRRKLRAIEHYLGRRRFDLEGERIKDVVVDLDLLLYNNEVNRSVIEPLPHPQLLERAYVAVPLADLAPNLLHPVTQEPIREIASRLREGAHLRQLFPTVRIEPSVPAMLEQGPPALAAANETASPTPDTALPGDIPHQLETQSAAPTVESLVTPESASDVQPPLVTVDEPTPAPKTKRGKKASSAQEAAASVSSPTPEAETPASPRKRSKTPASSDAVPASARPKTRRGKKET